MGGMDVGVCGAVSCQTPPPDVAGVAARLPTEPARRCVTLLVMRVFSASSIGDASTRLTHSSLGIAQGGGFMHTGQLALVQPLVSAIHAQLAGIAGRCAT